MNSTQIARLITIAVGVVATLVLTSAQLRVVQRPAPRHGRYLVAWVVCALVLGGLVSATDRLVGQVDTVRSIVNVVSAGAVSALALGVGMWWTDRSRWATAGSMSKLFTLVSIHGLTIVLAMAVLY